VVVSVGGFLGVGTKHVAVKWSELKVGRDGKDLTLTTDWTKDTLKAIRTTSTSVASPFARAADGQASRSAGPVRALPDGPFFLAGRKRGAGLRRGYATAFHDRPPLQLVAGMKGAPTQTVRHRKRLHPWSPDRHGKTRRSCKKDVQ
jgi:hypothetical protein